MKEKLIGDRTGQEVQGITGLRKIVTVPEYHNIRPQGFTFNVEWNQAFAAPATAVTPLLTTQPDIVVFPYPCQLLSVHIVAETTGTTLAVIDPATCLVTIHDNWAPSRNIGFDSAAKYANGAGLNAGWVDATYFRMNGRDNGIDLSSLGLIYNTMGLGLFIQHGFVAGDNLLATITLRFERVPID